MLARFLAALEMTYERKKRIMTRPPCGGEGQGKVKQEVLYSVMKMENPE
jgi:hypothetical protein